MPRDTRAYLWDVRSAADAIGEFIAGLDPAMYEQSELVRSAVERKFEIIGEALSQLAKLDVAIANRVPNFRAIVAFRNLLIHGYAAVDNRLVLAIAQTELPVLRAAVADLLGELRG